MPSSIAIVGIAFHLPGGLSDERSLWRELSEKRDLVGQVPDDRWAVSEFQHDRRSAPGRSITFSAGVLSRVDEFDAEFFNMSPREAAWLDPQHRLLLELSWEALENAGIRPSSMAGADCAVYVGISSFDYAMRGLDDAASMSAYTMTGNTHAMAANRLSYVYDLHGPSLAIDTACSSSLVSLHLACNCLRAGEASMALVGGVNLLLHPYPFIGFTKASMLSADGRCKAFDASGNGYVRSEGGAVLLLKPLDKALADGDDIQAMILASGVNADGARKTGLTVPSCQGQTELMGEVLAKSGLAAQDVDFIEAHGTGTPVGDPIEAAAIGAVYGRARATPLPIGTVKANLGHQEAASGLTGLIKTVLALKNRALPPLLHLATPNQNIDFDGLNLELVTEYRDLVKADGKPLVAGVNSFGFGGANAHVLLQEFRSFAEEAHAGPELPPPLFLSARSDVALRVLAGRYAAQISDHAQDYYDIAYAAAYRRERMEKRLAFRAASSDKLAEVLMLHAEGRSASGVVLEDRLPEEGGVAFVYSGNGAQRVGMGRKLFAESSRFREIVARIDAVMTPLAGFSIAAALQPAGSSTAGIDERLDDASVAQPLLFSIQAAVTTLLQEQGVVPTAVTGHSLGEVAAAWASGALTLEQACCVVVSRSRAQGVRRGMGRMAVVTLSEAAVQAVLAELGKDLEVTIAGINSPTSTTLSGKLADLERVRARLSGAEAIFRLLDLDYAFHSPQMDSVETSLVDSLDGLAPSATGRTAFVSTVTGDTADGASLDARYWGRNVRAPVRFAAAVTRLAALGCRVFIEIGPHPILQRDVRACLAAADIKARVLPGLSKNNDGVDRIADVALRAHLLANDADPGVFFPQPGRHVRLPNYPWQRKHHWYPRTSENLSLIERRRVHPLLGWRLPDAEAAWENTVDSVILPWLADHKLGGAVVFPASAYAELALAVAREWRGGERLAVEDLDIVSPIVFDGERARTLRVIVNPRDGGFQIKSRPRLSTDEWSLHAVGRSLDATDRRASPRIEPLAEPTSQIGREAHYRSAASLGLDYGPAFQGLGQARIAQGRLEGRLELPDGLAFDQAYLIHPALLDVCYQSLLDFFLSDIEAGQHVSLLPVSAGRIDLYRRAAATHFRACLRRRGARSMLADFELFDAAGDLVARVSGVRFRAAALKHQGHTQVSTWRIVPWLRPHPSENPTAELISTKDLVGRIGASLAGIEDRRRVWFKESLPLFEVLVLSFAYGAFQTLAEKDLTGAPPYTRWLAGLLRQEGFLVEQDGRWQLAVRGDLPAADEIWRALLQADPSCLPHLTLLGCIGRRLPELLAGHVDGQQVLDGLLHAPAVETLYNDSPAYLGTKRAIGNALGQFARILPEGRRLRVLEIAAGPSDLPRGLLKMLPADRLDYVLALEDEKTSQGLQMEYRQSPNVTLTILNGANWELAADRPLPKVFDVVVLGHVLHRAANPKAALGRVRRWLADDGILLLAESHPDWYADFQGGFGWSWWRHGVVGEPGGMAASLPSLVSPLASPEVWRQGLSQAGFDRIECFTEPAAEGLSEGAYLLLATNPRQAHVLRPLPDSEAWLLLYDGASSHLLDDLRDRLDSQGQRVVVAERMTEAALADVQHVVHALGWDCAPEGTASVLTCLLDGVKILAAHPGKSPKLWVVTRGGALVSGLPPTSTPSPAQAALWGFGRVVMNEYPALDCTLIDVACHPDTAEAPARLANELLHPDGANEIVLATRARYVPAISEDGGDRPVVADDKARFRLDFHMPGQLGNLLWLPETERALRPDEIEVRTRAAGLNFRDVMYLMGLLPDEAVEKGFAGASLGVEFSGVVTRVGPQVADLQAGDAVMGFGSSCFSSHVVTRADVVTRMPEDWTFAAGATVPAVFLTAYYALKHLADLQPGERVLIHGGAGGVGIAAIQLARHLGAEIFATAGNDEKRDFVRLLGADHVFDSRSLTFADDILAVTDGEGVDVVLNSLAGEALRRSLALLRPFGRFLELGKRDFLENTPIGLRPFKDNISYFGIDADQLLIGRLGIAARLFREIMVLFRDGVLVPLPHRVFAAERVVDAFRVMQQGRHIGKIVVSLADARPPIVHPAAQSQPARIETESTWLVTGGLEGFGLASARWLADRGVRNIVLMGRRGLQTPGAKAAVEELAARGVAVTALSCDVTNAEDVAAVVRTVHKTMPPLKGILHAAMVIDDHLIANLDVQSVEAALRPKLMGAWNLHQATLGIPLDHFVLYSSITTAIGSPGQANYVAANAALEGMAEMRHRMGLPATCVSWGPIGDAGYLARNAAVKDRLGLYLGKPPVAAEDALAQLDARLATASGSFAAANFDWAVLSPLLPSAASPRFAGLNRTLKDPGLPKDKLDLHAFVVGKTTEELAGKVRSLVVQDVAQILSVAADRIDPNRPLHDLGIDSLMAVELALELEQHLGIPLPVMMLNESPTIEGMTARIVDKLLEGQAAAGQAAPGVVAESLARQHGQELSREESEHVAKDAWTLAERQVRLTA